MTVAFDAATEAATWTTTPDPFLFTHTPSGTPKGVVVKIDHGTEAANLITSVTYGGRAMTAVPRATDTVTEPGAAYMYFLGAGIPTGAQTVSIDHTAGATVKHAVCETYTAAKDTEIGAFDTLSENAASPQLTLVTAKSSLRTFVIYSGAGATTDLTLLANHTAVHNHDYGNFVSRQDRQTTASAGSFTIGYTAANDDVAMVGIAIQEQDDLMYFAGWQSGGLRDAVATSGTPTVQSSIVRGGTPWALQCNPSATREYAIMPIQRGAGGEAVIATRTAETFYTFALRPTTLPGATTDILSGLNSTIAGVPWRINLEADGDLVAVGATTSAVFGRLRTGIWYVIKVRVTSNGTSYASLNSGTEQSFTASNFDQSFVVFGNNNTLAMTYDIAFDDYVVSKSAFAPDYYRTARLDPDGNGTYTSWTNDVASIDDVPSGANGDDGDTTFISSSTNLAAETFTFESCTAAGVSEGASILGVMSWATVRGESATALIQVRLRTGSFNDDTSDNAPNTTYVARGRIYDNNPDGEVEWTRTAVDALEAGVECNAALAVRATAVYIMVLYVPVADTHDGSYNERRIIDALSMPSNLIGFGDPDAYHDAIGSDVGRYHLLGSSTTNIGSGNTIYEALLPIGSDLDTAVSSWVISDVPLVNLPAAGQWDDTGIETPHYVNVGGAAAGNYDRGVELIFYTGFGSSAAITGLADMQIGRLLKTYGSLDNVTVEVNLTGIAAIGTTTLTRDSAQAKRGTWAAKCVTPGSVANEGCTFQRTTDGNSAPTVPIRVGVWVYQASGSAKDMATIAVFQAAGGGAISESTGPTISVPTATWTFLEHAVVCPALTSRVSVKAVVVGTQSLTFWADDAMFWTWVRTPITPVLTATEAWEDSSGGFDHVAEPAPFMDGSTLRMYYNAGLPTLYLAHAESADLGETWTGKVKLYDPTTYPYTAAAEPLGPRYYLYTSTLSHAGAGDGIFAAPNDTFATTADGGETEWPGENFKLIVEQTSALWHYQWAYGPAVTQDVYNDKTYVVFTGRDIDNLDQGPHTGIATVGLLTWPLKSAITVTSFAPTVRIDFAAVPITTAITVTSFAPVIESKIIVPPSAITVTSFAPIVTAGAAGNILVIPLPTAITVTSFAPTVSTPRLATPITAAITVTSFAPTVRTPRLVTPPTSAITVTSFRPTVTTSNPSATDSRVYGGGQGSVGAAARPGLAKLRQGSVKAAKRRI